MNDALLTLSELRTYFFTDGGVIKAVDGVSFTVNRGRTVALVGESGCGKSMTAASILRLIPPTAKIVSGEIAFKGRDLLKVSDAELRHVRGNEIAMIFQEPALSLNPVLPIGKQIVEALLLHREITSREANAITVEMLRKVGIPDPARRVHAYPHQLSGGMQQRVMIAMALSCSPDLLIADEPTTALDVTIQAQILDLLRTLQTETGMSLLLITHDLGVVAELAHDVVVMYAGKVVERTDVHTLFAQPRHPYTVGLFQSLPKIGEDKPMLSTIPGQVPAPGTHVSGCKFHPRCFFATEHCALEEPPARQLAPGHHVACWHAEKVSPTAWLEQSAAVVSTPTVSRSSVMGSVP